MVDAFLIVWGLLHTLEDPVVIVACAAIGGAAGAFTRRLDGATWSNGCAVVVANAIAGAVLTAITSAAAAFVGMELFPKYPKLVVGLILFASGIVDTTTDTGRNWVQREVFGRLLALFDAARNGGRYVPPTPSPGVPPPVVPAPIPPAVAPPVQPPAASPAGPVGVPPVPSPPTQGSPTSGELSKVPTATPNPQAKKGPW